MSKRHHVILEALQVKKDPTGTGRGILDLCEALAAKDRDLNFTVLTTSGWLFKELSERPGWRIKGCPQAKGGVLRKALFTQFRLPSLVRQLGGDLLHSLQFLVPLHCSCLQVATVHDMAWALFPETIEEPRRSYYRWLVPRSLAKVDAIVANSQSTATDTRRLFPGVADKIQVTPHGTPSWVHDRDCAAKPGQPQGARPFFLFVGTLEPRKNLARLMEAYEAFLDSERAREAPDESLPDLVFVGGRGWKNSHLHEPMAALTERGRLRILDYVGLDELWQLYCGALALVFPSLHEGFGLPVLEAMAAGLPVLTSDRSGTAEVSGDTALLVDPEDPRAIASGLARLAFEPELRARLAAAGPDHQLKWTWSRTADLTVSIYRRLLDEDRAK